MRNYAKLDIECVAERHLSLQDNFSFAEMPDTQLAIMMRETGAVTPSVRICMRRIWCARLRWRRIFLRMTRWRRWCGRR